MTQLADAAAGPHMRNHWTAMAAQWSALAQRVDAEDRVIRNGPEEVPAD